MPPTSARIDPPPPRRRLAGPRGRTAGVMLPPDRSPDACTLESLGSVAGPTRRDHRAASAEQNGWLCLTRPGTAAGDRPAAGTGLSRFRLHPGTQWRAARGPRCGGRVDGPGTGAAASAARQYPGPDPELASVRPGRDRFFRIRDARVRRITHSQRVRPPQRPAVAA